MYRRYQTAFVNDDDLDRMLAEADADARAWNRAPRYVVVEDATDGDGPERAPEDAAAETADDEVIDRSVGFVLEYLADASRDDHRRNIDGMDVSEAVRVTGLVLGTVFESPTREDKIVEVDYDACADAVAWAAVANLPEGVVSRYRKLLSRELSKGSS